MKLRAIFVSISASILLLFTPVASAHTNLLTEFPISESIVDEIPSNVELNFREDLLDLGTANSVEVTDPFGTEITTGETKVFKNSITRTLNPSDVSGSYVVKYRVVALDGHVITDTYTFSLKKVSAATSAPLTAESGQKSATSFWNRYAGLIFMAIGALVLTIIWRRPRK